MKLGTEFHIIYLRYCDPNTNIKGFLKDSTKQRNKDEKLREVVRLIRDVVYEAEDIIDASVTQATEVKSKGYFHKAFWTPTKLLNIAEKVDLVRQKINSIYGDKTRLDFANLRLEQGEPEQNEVNFFFFT
ncbi:hypothetical protein ACS0TY_015686 [Phlomoides rotata]